MASGLKSFRPSQAWAVIGVVFLGMAVAIGGTHYAFGVFVEPLEKEFGWSRTEVTASLSFSAVSALVAPFIGRALDLTFGLRPLMENVWHWYLISFVHFVAFPGASMLAGPKLVGVWFPRTRGRMMGMASMGANFGGIILPPALGALIMATTWRWGFIALGSLAGLVGLVAVVVVRDRKGGDGDTETGAESKARGPVLAFDRGATVREAFRSYSFYAMTFGIIAANFAYSSILSQIIPHLEAEGLSQESATLFLSIMAVFGMAGKVSFGFLTERYASRKVLGMGLFIQCIALVALITLPGSQALYVFAPVLGLGFGGMGTAMPMLAQDTVGLKNFGTLYGLVTLATVSSSLLGPLLMGGSFDLLGSYNAGFIVVIAIFGLGILTLQAARPMPQANAVASPA